MKIRSHFSLKLHKIVDDTMTHKMVLEKERDPTLEFIKHVFAVLCLDQSVQHDILVSYVTSFISFIHEALGCMS
jgi:hypothetical protein